MPNVMANAQGFFRTQSSYVPKMQYSADVNFNGGTRVDFGVPVAGGTAFITGINIATAGSADLSGIVEFPELYGRTVQIALSGAGTPVITINGYDYLGQGITEQITAAGAGPVASKKAFKSFRNVTFGATAGTTLSIAPATGFGLPYKALRCQFETAGGALVAAGTLTAPALTDPATATSLDPRGIYVPTTVPNGVYTNGVLVSGTWITAVFDMVNDVNAAGNGGLHGIAHYAA